MKSYTRLLLTQLAVYTGFLYTPIVAGKTISIAWEAAPRSIDPRFALDANSQYLEDLLHCSLIKFDSNGGLINDLSEKFEWANNKSLKITLKKSYKFGDGQPVKVDDVVATYQSLIGEKAQHFPRSGAFRKVTQIKKIDDSSLKFELSEPDAAFITNLVIGILPKATVEAKNPNLQSFKGCGLFYLDKQSPTELVLNRINPPSKTEKGLVDSITIKIVKDETTRYAKLKKGEVDIIQNLISRDKVKEFSKSSQFKVMKKGGLNTTYIGFNMRDPILSRKEVRQAIAHAIDKDSIIKFLLMNYAIPANTLLLPSDPCYNPNIKTASYDPEKANKLLDKAGYTEKDKMDSRFELTYTTTTDITRIAIAKAIASNLKKVGINVKVRPLEWSRFKKNVESGSVQLWSLAWIGFKDPDIYRYAFGSENFPPNGGNRGFYKNPELDSLLTKALATTDNEERKKIYWQAQDIINDELPYVFLWHEEIFAVMRQNIHNYDIYADGRFSALATAQKL